jgi:hypothetical protein
MSLTIIRTDPSSAMQRPWPLLAFLIALVIFGLIERGPIVRQWSAMYPSDHTEKTALQLCYIEDHGFNRLSPTARTVCYERWLPILAYAAQPDR